MKDLQAGVLVLGGGAAGALAAVAARRAGKPVVMVRRGDGATMMSSGAVDVAEHHGNRPLGLDRHAFNPGARWHDAARRVAATMPWHPYARVQGCVDAVGEALAILRDLAHGIDLSGSADGNNLVLASTIGTAKRTALAQGTMARGNLGDTRRGAVIVVHLPHVVHGDGRHVAAALDHLASLGDGGREALGRVEMLLVPGVTAPDDGLRGPHDLARRLPTDATRDVLLKSLKDAVARAGEVRCVLLPPLFGLGGPAGFVAGLEKALGVPVAELLSAPPSVPGERLQRALDEGVAREGVTVVEGRATAALIEEGRVRSIVVDPHDSDTPVRIGPEQVVLATGKYLAGGIRREERFSEPLLRLPVFIDGVHVDAGFVGEHVGERPEDDQPFMRAGVLTDEELRPLDTTGRVVALQNVRAAGSVLSGYDAARHGTGMGVAAVTGMLAGRWAAFS